jgi:hypothetical protein
MSDGFGQAKQNASFSPNKMHLAFFMLLVHPKVIFEWSP